MLDSVGGDLKELRIDEGLKIGHEERSLMQGQGQEPAHKGLCWPHSIV